MVLFLLVGSRPLAGPGHHRWRQPVPARARWPRPGLGRSLAKGTICMPPFNHQIDWLQEGAYILPIPQRERDRGEGRRQGCTGKGVDVLDGTALCAPTRPSDDQKGAFAYRPVIGIASAIANGGCGF